MFRSLFIGFLILSALTSKGVGIQINQNTAISSDMLLELYNAAVAYADMQVEFSDAKVNGTFLCNATETTIAISELLRSVRHDSQVAWTLPESSDNCRTEQCRASDRLFNPSCKGEIYSCGSDISPPFCR